MVLIYNNKATGRIYTEHRLPVFLIHRKPYTRVKHVLQSPHIRNAHFQPENVKLSRRDASYFFGFPSSRVRRADPLVVHLVKTFLRV